MNAYFFSKKTILAAFLLVAAVSLKAQINLDVTAKNPTCNGYTNGEATATASNGTAPYTFKWSNGATGASLYSVTGGTFTVTVTDAANQTVSKSVTVTAPAPLVASASAQGGACDTVVNWTASATGGTAPYKFTWLDFKTNKNTEGVTLTKPTRGSYFLQVTDANGCTASKVIEVTGDLSVTLKLVDATCGGTCDGAAEAIVTGGKEPYTYKWNFKDMTGPVLFPIPGGDYSVTVTDANGCKKEAKGFVFEPEILKANLRIENVCSDNGSATVTPTGGRTPYTAKWSNGATGFNVQNLKTGQYFVTVSDAFGCNVDGQINISKPSLDLVLTKTDASCAGVSNGEIVTHVKSGSLGPYKYDWSNGGPNDLTLKNVASGNYRLTVTDGAGCKDSTQITVNNLKTLSLATSSINSACGDVKTGGVSVNGVTNGVGPFSFKWSNDSTTQNISGVGAGNYTVTVTDAQGCRVVSNPINVIEEATAFNIVPTVTDATCGKNNGTIALTVTGGIEPYKYSRPLSNLASGDYNVIITDAKGCSASRTFKVGGKGGLKADFAVSPMNCDGDSVQYKFSSTSTGDLAGATFTWLFGTNRTVTGANQELKFGNLNEEARLVVKNTEGCTDTVKKSFQVNTLNVSVPKTFAICDGAPVSIVAKNNNPNFGVTYDWQPTNLIESGANTATPKVKPAVSGVTKVWVKLTNAAGCSRTDTVTINSVAKNGLKPADIVQSQDCNSRQVSFSNKNTALANLYRWNFGDAANPTAGSNDANATYNYPQSGNVTVTLIPTLGCLDTLKVPVSIRNGAAVSVDAGKDTASCSTATVGLKATSAATKFEWSASRNFTNILGTEATVSVTPTAQTVKYFVRATDATGCTAIDSVEVRNAAVRVTRDNQALAVCNNQGKLVALTNQNAGDVLTATWLPSSAIEGSNTILNPTIKATTAGAITGVIKNQFGCELRDTIRFSVNSVTVSAVAKDSIIYKDTETTILATPAGMPNFRFNWTPTGTIAGGTNPQVVVKPSETTTYTVEVTDVNGCKATTTQLIKVLDPKCEEPFIFVPRAFSPNTDGLNETVHVYGEYLTEVEFVIYNRWGEEVFRTNQFEESAQGKRSKGWDGRHKDDKVSPDVYGYYVRGRCQKNEEFFVKGNITVLK